MPSVRLQCVRDWQDLVVYQSSWDSLVELLAQPHVYHTYEWNASFASYYGKEAEPLVLFAFLDDELVGIAPLMLLRKRVLGRWRQVIQFIGTHHADSQDWLVHPDHPRVVQEMLAFLLDLNAQWDLWYLLDVPDDSLFLAQSEQFLSTHHKSWTVRPLYEIPTYLAGDPLRDHRMVHKSDVDRRERQLRKRGQAVSRSAHSLCEAQGMLGEFVAMHVSRWSATATPSIYRRDRERRLLYDMAEQLFPKGLIQVWGLYLDGKPMAMSIQLVYGTQVDLYRSAYDLNDSLESPGGILLKHRLQYMLNQGAMQISFGAGNEAYKKRYTNSVRRTCELRVYRHHIPFLLDSIFIGLRGYLSPLFMRSSILRPIGTWVRTRWPDLNI